MSVDAEVDQGVQTCQTVGGEGGELAVGDGEVLQLLQVLQTVLLQSGEVGHQLSALDGEGHGALPGDHAEVGLVVLGVDASQVADKSELSLY